MSLVARNVRRVISGMELADAVEHCLTVIEGMAPSDESVANWHVRLGLSRQQATMLEMLWRHRPNVVTHEALFESLHGGRYGHDTPFPEGMRVQVWKIRQKLPEGVKIINHHGVGYALTGYEVWEDQVADT